MCLSHAKKFYKLPEAEQFTSRYQQPVSIQMRRGAAKSHFAAHSSKARGRMFSEPLGGCAAEQKHPIMSLRASCTLLLLPVVGHRRDTPSSYYGTSRNDETYAAHALLPCRHPCAHMPALIAAQGTSNDRDRVARSNRKRRPAFASNGKDEPRTADIILTTA